MGELAAALALDRSVRVNGARQARAIPGGIVIRHPSLPSIHHLNAVVLEAPLAGALRDPEAIGALAERHLGDLGHRHVVADGGEPLAPGLRERGWRVQRTVFMVWRGTSPPAADPRARRTGEDELRGLQLELYAEERHGQHPDPVADALVAALVAGQDAVRAGSRSFCFVAGEDERALSACTLFVAHDAAMIDEVGTLRAHRGRGLAKAVVTAALRHALDLGARLVAIPADAEDWPQLIYAGLGFEPVGVQHAFTRTVGSEQ